MSLPPRFKCPTNMAQHLAHVFAGEYDIFTAIDGAPVVLDIGANVGAFAWWANARWPGAQLVCVEPNPRALAILEQNASHVKPAPKVIPCAVTLDAVSKVQLYQGGVNLGEATTLPAAATSRDTSWVDAVHVDELPACDILKADCEGREPAIFRRYVETHEKPYAFLAEYHTAEDREVILECGREYGYARVKVEELNATRGIVCLRLDVRRP